MGSNIRSVLILLEEFTELCYLDDIISWRVSGLIRVTT